MSIRKYTRAEDSKVVSSSTEAHIRAELQKFNKQSAQHLSDSERDHLREVIASEDDV